MFEKGWLASAIDGEGSIRMVGKYNTVSVSVCNTNKEFVEYAHKLCDAKTKIREDNRHIGNRKTLYEVQIHSKEDILNVLPQILPYLIIKKNQAEKAIEVSKLKKDRREKCQICENKHYSKGYCYKHWYEFIGKKYNQEFHIKNKDKHSSIQREYYKRNKDKFLKKTKEWQKNNPEKVREYKRRWREKHDKTD